MRWIYKMRLLQDKAIRRHVLQLDVSYEIEKMVIVSNQRRVLTAICDLAVSKNKLVVWR